MAYSDWKIGESIGEGGQAHVYKATRADDDTIYAIKRFKNPKRQERSNTEILNMKSLKSLGVNVPEIVDSGEYKDGRPYFVIKYYENKSLECELKNNCKNIDRIEFAKQLCSEIRKMNNVSYVHRDLKPANILLDENWKPVIADFGLSNNADEQTGYTKSGEPIGSTHYMHPKAFEAKTIDKQLHYSFDGYSFGKILHEILTGQQLFGFSEPNKAEEYKTVVGDLYIANKILRGIKRLLSNDLNEIGTYWSKFPIELEHLLSTPFESVDLDSSTIEKLKEIYLNKVKQLGYSISNPVIFPDDIKDEVLAYIKASTTFKFLNELMIELNDEERVNINESVNLREILEGVGVKSNYGIDPLYSQGRKQSLVKLEILISPPKSNRQIGISILDNTPYTIILLCIITKNKDWIDIEQDSIVKTLIDESSRIEKSYLSVIDNFILTSLE
jgi:serine/threonine protein kinase